MSLLHDSDRANDGRWQPSGPWLFLAKGEIAVGVLAGLLGLFLVVSSVLGPPATDDEPERGVGGLFGLFLGTIACASGVPG
jgi:hypothetical protein